MEGKTLKLFEDELSKVREDIKNCTSGTALGILVEQEKWILKQMEAAPAK